MIFFYLFEKTKQKQKDIETRSSKNIDNLIRALATKCMQPAMYICSGDVQPHQYHHYALASPVYTHFTSPIRRYADVMVHRLLAAAIDIDHYPPSPQTLDMRFTSSTCHSLNQSVRNAQLAGRSSSELFLIMYLAEHSGVYQGSVTEVRRNGLGVMIAQFGIEGEVLFAELTNAQREEDWEVMDDGNAVESKKHKRKFVVLDSLDVFVSVETSATGRRKIKMKIKE
jgi:exosome complex exonuclease DIS3/RRP44